MFLVLLIAGLFGVKACAQNLRDLGSITVQNGLTWTANTETNIAGYNVYVSDASLTIFTKVATVTANKWPGDASKNVNGSRAVYVTALASFGANSDAIESAPSEKVLVNFRAGVPQPPKNVQLYTVVTAAATSSLPPPPPLPTVQP